MKGIKGDIKTFKEDIRILKGNLLISLGKGIHMVAKTMVIMEVIMDRTNLSSNCPLK